MGQSSYYAVHRFVKVNGVFIPDCIEWPDFVRDVQKTDVATDEMVIFPIATGMTKYEGFEFTFNRSKLATSADIYLEEWPMGEGRQVEIIETDAVGDPEDPNSRVGSWDLGKAQRGKLTYPGGGKESPKAATVKVEILLRGKLVFRRG